MASAQILTQKTSWESWIFAVKEQAEQDELWQYIDPSLEKEPSFPVKPVPKSYFEEIQLGATKFTDLEDKGLITYAQRQHAQALTEWHRLHDAFKVIAKLVVNCAKTTTLKISSLKDHLGSTSSSSISSGPHYQRTRDGIQETMERSDTRYPKRWSI
jgi:hypothetical protein